MIEIFGQNRTEDGNFIIDLLSAVEGVVGFRLADCGKRAHMKGEQIRETCRTSHANWVAAQRAVFGNGQLGCVPIFLFVLQL